MIHIQEVCHLINMLSPAPEISSAKKKVIHDSSVMRCTVEHLLAIKKRSKDVDNSVIVSSDAIHLLTVANTIRGQTYYQCYTKIIC